MAASKDLTATVHTIIRRTISQSVVNAAVKLGMDRKQIQAGSVTCVQRFGGSVNLHVDYHLPFLEGVYVDRAAKGLKSRFVKVEPPSDAEIARVIHQISRHVIPTLRHQGYLEADANGDLLYTFSRPWSDGTTGIKLSPLELLEKLAAPRRTGAGHGRSSASFCVPWGPVVAEVRPLRVTRVRRGGFSGQTGGYCPHGGLLRGVSRMSATGGRQAKPALKYLYAPSVPLDVHG
jgi:hypothetical protein